MSDFYVLFLKVFERIRNYVNCASSARYHSVISPTIYSSFFCRLDKLTINLQIRMSSPLTTLNNGQKIPIIGLGTSILHRTSDTEIPQEYIQVIKDAIDAGYRHFDGAYFYGNEKEIGLGIKAKIEDGTVKREDLFVTSKLWNTFHPYEMVVPACKESLKRLGLDYIDLYLIHWPFGWKEGGELWPKVGDEIQFSEADYIDTWRGMEDCVKQGLVKSIGLSNFNSEQIDRILSHATIKPVVNQIEVNPNLNQTALIDFCRERGIQVIGYAPLGRPTTETDAYAASSVNDPVIKGIATKYGKSPAQIILKYLINRGICVIPKSVTKSRIIENIAVFDFELGGDDLKEIDKLDKGYRIFAAEHNKTHKYYPFNIMY